MAANRSQPGRARSGEYVRQIALADDARADGPMPHPPRKLYRISEIAEHLGITRQTLHNYATIGLIAEEDRTPGGQRLFDVSVFDRLFLVQRLKPLHRLSEIRRLLADHNRPPAHPSGGPATRQSAPTATHSPGGDLVSRDRTDTASNEKETRSREQPEP
jgi:DNA-binding transcriptional MerR regulator